MSRKKKQFKVRYVVLGVLAILVIAAAVAVGTHWDLIQAAKLGMTMDQDTILADQEEKDRQIEESLGIEGLITDEMIAQAQAEIEQSLSDGSPAPADPAEQGGSAQDPGGSTQGPGGSAQEPGGTDQSGKTPSSGAAGAGQSLSPGAAIVAEYTAKLYGVRGAFEGRLNGLVAEAKSEYLALPPDQQNGSGKSAILSSKLGQAESMEAECDAMVESLLGEMEAELKAAGESTAPVGELRSYYKEAKVNQKAYYLSLLRGQ